MDSTETMGLILVAVSAVLLAAHWQQWRASRAENTHSAGKQLFIRLQLRRRLVASSLVGIVGMSLAAMDALPRTPLSITVYLLSLVLASVWILWLGLADWRASRRFHHEEQLNQLAAELQRANALQESADT